MDNTLLIILLAPLPIVVLLLFLFRRKSNHQRKRAMAKRIAKKIETIECGARCFGYLRTVDAYAFEELVLDSFERRGFKVMRNKRYSGDGGIDGRVNIQGYEFFIQSKRYGSYIQKKHVEDFRALCVSAKTFGLFVHCGKTGKGSRDEHYPDISIISGSNLVQFLKSDEPIKLLLNSKHYIEV